MKKITHPLLAISILLMAFGCSQQKSEEKKSDPENFKNYITGYTSGMIESGSPVSVVLAQPVTGFEAGAEISEKVFRFSPSVDGKTFLVNDHTVEFRPEKSWPSGKKIHTEFNLHRFFEVQEKLKTFSFDFNVIPLDFTVYRGRLDNAGTAENYMKRYDGKFVAADEIKIEDIREILSASSPHAKLQVRVTRDGPKEFSYVIDSIPRRESSYQITLKWDGKPVDIQKTGSFEIEIPSMYEFKLLNVDVEQSAADQHIDLVFSDPLNDDQDIEGLVSIRDQDNIKLSKRGNTITIYPQNRLYGEKTVIVDRSLKNSRGQELGNREELIVAMEALKPEVTIIGQGVIMPDSRDLILSFKAVSLRAVDVTVYKVFSNNVKQFFQFNNYTGENNLRYVARPVYRSLVRLDENPDLNLQQWNAFSVDLTGMIRKDPNAIYRVKFSFRKEYAVYGCDGNADATLEEFENQELYSGNEKDYWDGDRSYWYEYPDDYNWQDRDNPCTDSYYVSSRFPERNLLASNLGLIAKSADNRSFSVTVTNLLTTAPVINAKLEFYNMQKQLLGSTATGSDGMANIRLDQVPFLLMAEKEGDRSWLRLDDGSSLSVSNFDVSGAQVQEGIKGMIYGERGVWRPGDTLFLTFVMDDVQNRLPKDHPVIFKLYNARGQMVAREVVTQGLNGFYVFNLVTDPEAPTGNWSAQVQVGGATFAKRLRIETIKPNRLKVNLTFTRDILMNRNNEQTGVLKSNWLHGAPANNLKAEVNVKLVDTDYKFKGYEKFTFSDPTKNYRPNEYEVFSDRLNSEGRAVFPLDLQVNSNAPGMLQAVFNTRVYEEGGNFSTDYTTIPFAPYSRFAGVHVPEGGTYKNRLQTDTSHKVEIVTVDVHGKPVAVKNLQVRVYRLSWRWWWSSSSDNLASWVRGEDSEQIMKTTVSTGSDGKASFDFRVDYPQWGRYFIHVSDNEGGHSTGLPVYVDWPHYYSRSGRVNPAGATVLNFSSDKENYEPGENAVISFPSSSGSRALASLESGSGILRQWWIDATEESTSFSFEITPEMAPNAYLHLTLLQPHAQTTNDLPIRMYGVIPLMVEDPETKLIPQITVPEEVRPQSAYSIKVSEKNGRPMTYTLAVVDEGLLDLTNFETPDPWKNFYAREALGVKTWDLFDEVLGAYGGRLQKVLAIGGDREALKVDDKKAERFKPVVSFLGPFFLETGETATHRLYMPNYIGSVRVMVIAGHEQAWGSVADEIPVRQPLMILPTAPRVLGPDEEFDLPVTVFAMKDNIRTVELTVKVESPVMMAGPADQTLKFEKMGEQMAYFRLRVQKNEGIGRIRVEAKSGGETSFEEIEIQVRNPSPVITTSELIMLEAGSGADLVFDFFGMTGTNSATVDVSGLPSFELEKKLNYLIRYPYGCVEQVTSAAFPQLFLSNLMDLSDRQKVQIDENIRKAIQQITKYQADGGLSYWPGGRSVSDWSTTYAGHFMLLAEQKGYLIPYDFKQKWLDYQNETANEYFRYRNKWYFGNDLAQAYRLYTLALAGKPNISAMNRLRGENSLYVTARWRLAAAYLLAGMPEAAEALTDGAGLEARSYETPGRTFGSRLRDQAMILEVLVLMDRKEVAFRLLNEMAQAARNSYFSTQTAAFTLVAFARFAGDQDLGSQLDFSYTLHDEQKNIRAVVPVYQIDVEGDTITKTMHLENKGKKDLFITQTIMGQPVGGIQEDASLNLEMSINYETIDGKPLDIASIRQGTDFEAIVTIKNPGRLGTYENMALSQIFPSGWEIINLRLNDQQSTKRESHYEYRDIRDDRVYTFFDLAPGKAVTYRVMLNAAYAGSYLMPGVSCEAMYEGHIYARTKGRWVEVVK
ncbi:MAG: alpha-2-macroglobulin [Bacteroidales bacterium]